MLGEGTPLESAGEETEGQEGEEEREDDVAGAERYHGRGGVARVQTRSLKH